MNKLIELIRSGGFYTPKVDPRQYDKANARKDLTLLMGNHFATYDQIRIQLSKGQPTRTPVSGGVADQLLEMMIKHKLIAYNKGSQQFRMIGKNSKKFIDGTWLEEYTYFAAKELGAENALFGQELMFKSAKLGVRNREVDVIFQKDDKLVFISNKCATALIRNFGSARSNFRGRMKKAIYELDFFKRRFENIVNFQCGLVLSSDLIDEMQNDSMRHSELMKISKIKNVPLIGLDHLIWADFIPKLRETFE